MASLPIYESPLDRRNRPLRELRISVTDRCNFRCSYCMPKERFGTSHQFLPRREILTFEEITKIAGAFVALGVRKIRLTGGEPLLRSDLPVLVRMLHALGELDLALTTNGSRLEAFAVELARAGLGRVTVSLDSLDPEVFRRMANTDVPVAKVLAGIDLAQRSGLGPVKINAVIRRGENDGTLVELARHFRGSGAIVRFIEYMDVGTCNGWRAEDVVPAREIVERIDREMPLEPIPGAQGEVARRYRYKDGGGEIGVIASVSEPFCGECSRARLSAEGRLYTCLFASSGLDLRSIVRGGVSAADLRSAIEALWRTRDDRYSETRSSAGPAKAKRIEMSYIGG